MRQVVPCMVTFKSLLTTAIPVRHLGLLYIFIISACCSRTTTVPVGLNRTGFTWDSVIWVQPLWLGSFADDRRPIQTRWAGCFRWVRYPPIVDSALPRPAVPIAMPTSWQFQDSASNTLVISHA